MADIELTIELKAKGGERSQRVIRGTDKEIRNMARSTAELMSMSQRQIDSTVRHAVRGLNSLRGASGKIKIMGQDLQGRFANTEDQKMDLRLKRANVQTTENLARAMRSVLIAARGRTIQMYTSHIGKMRDQMLRAGMSVSAVEENLKGMHLALARVKRFNVGRRASAMAGSGMGIEEARLMGGNLFTQQQGKIGAMTGHVRDNLTAWNREMNSAGLTFSQQFGGHVKSGMMRASGAIGFTLIDMGTKIQNFFSETRIKGQLAGATSAIGRAFGGIFGDALGSIGADIGRAIGLLAETMLNLLMYKIKQIGAMIGGVMKGLGYTIASGVLGGLMTSLAGNPLIGMAIGALIGVIIFAFTAGMQAISSFFSSVINEMIGILDNAVKIVSSLLSAGFKIISSTVTAVTKGITQVWKQFWSTMVNLTKTSIDKMMEMLTKLADASLKAFMTFENKAVKAAKEIADIYGKTTRHVEKLIAGVALDTGLSVKDVGGSAFITVSSGFRDVAQAQLMMSESAKLALADMTDLSSATGTLTTIYNNYKKQISDVSEVTKILAAATTLGTTDLAEFGPAMTFVSSTASRFKVSLKDLAGTMAAMTRLFGKGSAQRVARYVNRGLEGVFMPNSPAAKALRELGIDIKELYAIAKGKAGFSQSWLELLEKLKNVSFENIRKIFPTIQSRRFQIMLENLDEFKQIMGEMDKIDVQDQIDMGGRTTERNLGRILNVWELMKVKIGGVLSDVLQFVFFSSRMEKLWKKLGELLFSDQMQQAVTKISNALKQMLVPAAEKLYSVFVSIYKVFEDISMGTLVDTTSIASILNSMRGMYESVERVYQKLTGGEGSIRTAFVLLVDVVAWAMNKMDYHLRSISLDPKIFLGDVKNWWESIKPDVVSFSKNIVDYLHSQLNLGVIFAGGFLGDSAVGLYEGLMSGDFKNDKVSKTFQILALTIKKFFLQIWGDIFLDLFQKFLEMDNRIANIIKSAISELISIGAFFAALVSSMISMIETVGKAWTEAFSGPIRGLIKVMDLLVKMTPGGALEKIWHSGVRKEAKAALEYSDENSSKIFKAMLGGIASASVPGAAKAFEDYDKNMRGVQRVRDLLKEKDPKAIKGEVDKLRSTNNQRLLGLSNEIKLLTEEMQAQRARSAQEIKDKATQALNKGREIYNEADKKRTNLSMRGDMVKSHQIALSSIPAMAQLMAGSKVGKVIKTQGGFTRSKDPQDMNYLGRSPEAIQKQLRELVSLRYGQLQANYQDRVNRGEDPRVLAPHLAADLAAMGEFFSNFKANHSMGKISVEELTDKFSNALRGAVTRDRERRSAERRSPPPDAGGAV